MAEDYSWSWDAPDYGYDWLTPEEETPAFDFGADVDWGNDNYDINMDWMNDDWSQPVSDPWQIPEYTSFTDDDWLKWEPTDFTQYGGIDSLYTPDEWGKTGINMDWQDQDWDYGYTAPENIFSEDWGQDYFGTPTVSPDNEFLNDIVAGTYGLRELHPDVQSIFQDMGIGSMEEFNQEFPVTDVDPWENVRDASGYLDPSKFTGPPQGRFPGLRNFFMQPRTPGGTPRLSSPFMGGASFTPPFIKRIGDALGLGGGSGLEDFWKEGYGKGGQGGLMNLIPGLGGGMGGGQGGGMGGGMGSWMMPLGLGILAAKAAKEDRGVDLTPSVTMDPLGRYTLSGTGPEERKEFGLGEIPTSLDFSAYEDIMGGS